MRISLACLVALSIALPASAEPVKPRPAAAFVDSIGVCTHWGYGDTPYGASFEKVRDLLIESGIRHIRDGLDKPDRIAELADHGISLCVASDPRVPPAKLVDQIATLNRAHPGAIDAIEGTNEPDLFWASQHLNYNGEGDAGGEQGIHRGAVAFQRDLYRAARANPETAKLTIIGPALGKTYEPGKALFSPGELAPFVDWGNFHPYAGGNPFSVPYAYAGLEKYTWNGTHPTSGMDEAPYQFDTYGPAFKPKPMAATECGYSTNTKQCSLEDHAKYIPRLYAEYFRLGIQRSYVYELVDEWDKPDDREANFGLLKHDLTRKPAFVAVQRLIALLKDPSGPTTRPVRPAAPLNIDFKVTPPAGFDRTQFVHHLLLNKSDGTYALLIWHEIALSDSSQTPWRELKQPDMPMQIKLPGTVREAIVHDVNAETDAARTIAATGGVVNLDVPDHILVVMFRTTPAAR